jgi:hypothetical protein
MHHQSDTTVLMLAPVRRSEPKHLGPFGQRQSNRVSLTHQALLGSLPGWRLSAVPGREKMAEPESGYKGEPRAVRAYPQGSAVYEAETFAKVSMLFRGPIATPPPRSYQH